MSGLKEKVLKKVDRDKVIELLQASVRLPSVTGEEKKYAQFIFRKMEEFGFDICETYEFSPNRPNVWGVLKGTGGGHSLLFEAHTDTVDVEGWTERWKGTEKENPFSGTLIEQEIWGRGSADNKAGMTALLIACKALKDAGVKLKGHLIASATGDEENLLPDSHAGGITAFTEKIKRGEIPKADFAIYTEPSECQVFIAHWGFITGELTVTGKEAYIGTPWVGVNAINKMHSVLTDIFEYSNRIWKEKAHPLVGRPFVVVHYISGGTKVQTVPGHCTISLLRKIIPGEKVQEVAKELESIMMHRAIEQGLDYSVKWPMPGDVWPYGYSPSEVSSEELGVKVLKKCIIELTGKRKEEVVGGAPYCGESSWLQAPDIGIPTVYCGPGRISVCHTTQERVDVDQVVQAAKIYALTALKYCNISK